MSDLLAAYTNTRHFGQFLFHNPFDIDAQPSVNQKNIIKTLVVGNDNIGSSFLDVFSSCDLNKHRSQKCIQSRPDHSAEIASYALIDNRRDQDGNNTKNNGIEEYKRQEEQPFIGLVNNI